MAQFDGSINIDTSLDSSGIVKGMATVSASVVAALSGMAVAAVKVGSDFYAAMSEVQAISGASGEDLARLTAKAKEMGATTKFSASESAEALKYMGMAGWDAQQMIDGLPGVMNLAAASGEALGTVSDIVTDALTAMGLQAKDASHFADVLAVAASASNTNVGMMGQTFKYAAPLAGALGYNIEDLSVAIGLMANSGIKADQAGTALRAIFTRLVKPTKESAAAMQKLGLEIENADGIMRPLNDVLVDLRDGFDGLTESEKAQYGAMLAGQEALSGVLALVSASDDDFEKLTAAINDANGAAERMAKTMNDNLKGDLEEMGGALETIQIQIFEAFNGAMREAVQVATEAFGQLSDEIDSPEMQEALAKIGDLIGDIITRLAEFAADAIPKLIDAIVWVIDNFETLLAIAKVVGAAFAGFEIAQTIHGITSAVKALFAALSSNPIGITLAAIGLVAIGTNELRNALSDCSEEAKKHQAQTEKMVNSSKDLQKQITDTSQSFFDEQNAIAEDVAAIDALAAELDSLRSKSTLTSEEQTRLTEVVSELGAKIPEVTEAYTAHRHELGLTQKQLEALETAYTARQSLQSYEKQHTKALEDQNAVIAERKGLEGQYNAILALRDKTQQELNESTGLWGEITKGLGINQQAIDIEEYDRQLQELGLHIDVLAIQEEHLGTVISNTSQWIVDDKQKIADAEGVLASEAERTAGQVSDLVGKAKGYREAAETLAEANNELIKSLGESAQEYQDNRSVINQNATAMHTLIQETAALAGQTDKTAAQEAKLNANLTALSGMLPSISLFFDEQTGALLDSTDAMQQYADAQTAHLGLADAEERYIEICQELVQVDTRLAETAAERQAIEAADADILARINELRGKNGETADENADAIKRLKDEQLKYGETLAVLGTQESDLQEERNRLTDEQEWNAERQAAAQKVVDDAREKGILVAEEEVEARKKLAEELAKKVTAAEQQLLDDMTKAYERYAEHTQNALSTINAKNGVSLKEAIKNLEDNQKAMDKWFTDLETIAARGADADFLAWLREMGPEQAKLIGQLATASNADFTKLQNSWQAGSKQAVDEVTNQFEAGEAGVSAAAQAIVDKVVLGFSDNPEMEAAAKNLIGKALEGANAGVTEQSEALKKTGADMDAKMAEGVAADKKTEGATKKLIGDTNKAASTEVGALKFGTHGQKIDADIAAEVPKNKKTETAAKTLVTTTCTATQSQVSASNFATIGRMMDQGMADGLYAGQSIVTSAARAVAQAAYNAAKAALDINSPSKKFRELGEFVVEGFDGPIEDGAQRTAKTVRSWMDSMYAVAQAQSARLVQSVPGQSPSIDYDRLGSAVGDGIHYDQMPSNDGPSEYGVYLDGVRVGTMIEPTVSKNQAVRYQAAGRSGYRDRV